MRQCLTSQMCCHPSLCPLAAETLTLMGLNPHTDTESQWYYSWNACYVFSTNERMKQNKQRGQIKRERKLRKENTLRQERKKRENGVPGVFHSNHIPLLDMMTPSPPFPYFTQDPLKLCKLCH